MNWELYGFEWLLVFISLIGKSAQLDESVFSSLGTKRNLSVRKFDIDVTVKNFDIIVSWGEEIVSENQTVCLINKHCLSEDDCKRFPLPCLIDRERRSCTISHEHDFIELLEGSLRLKVVELNGLNECTSCANPQDCNHRSSRSFYLKEGELERKNIITPPFVTFETTTTAIKMTASVPSVLCGRHRKVLLKFDVNKISELDNQSKEAENLSTQEIEYDCLRKEKLIAKFTRLDSGTLYDISVSVKLIYFYVNLELVSEEYRERILTTTDYTLRGIRIGTSLAATISFIIFLVIIFLSYRKMMKKVIEIPDYLKEVKCELEGNIKNENLHRKPSMNKEIPDLFIFQNSDEPTIKATVFDKQENPNLLLSASSGLERSPEDKTDIDHKKSKINVYVSSPSQIIIDVNDSKEVMSSNIDSDVEYPEILTGMDTYITKVQHYKTYFSKEKFLM